jgi:hypothetical protein
MIDRDEERRTHINALEGIWTRRHVLTAHPSYTCNKFIFKNLVWCLCYVRCFSKFNDIDIPVTHPPRVSSSVLLMSSLQYPMKLSTSLPHFAATTLECPPTPYPLAHTSQLVNTPAPYSAGTGFGYTYWGFSWSFSVTVGEMLGYQSWRIIAFLLSL